MKNFLFLILALFIFSGCATANPRVESASTPTASTTDQNQTTQPPSRLKNMEQKDLNENPIPQGAVFSKVDFQGVLKSSYVKLTIVSVDDPQKQYQLYVGDRARQNSLGWDVKAIKPAYFFIELPVGNFKISAISAPVGSALATEDVDISFSVLEDEVVYLGTFKVFVSKERIRLGGVPVIKPGFEYEAQVIDNNEEAKTVFHQRYPEVKKDIKINLMVIRPHE